MANNYVNICMVTFDRLEFTKRSIDSIIKHTRYPYVLTVVDNSSSDGTQTYLSSLRNKGIIKNLILSDKNNGVAKGSNMAWQCEPDAPYYLKFDNDMVIQKDDWLAPMVSTIATLPFLGVLGYNVEPVSYPVFHIKGSAIRFKRNNLGGACFLIPKRTERLLGHWSEEYSLSGEEDVDYCERLRLIGLAYGYMEDEDMMFHLPAGKAARIDPNDFKANDGKEEIEQPEYRAFKDEQRYKVIKEDRMLEKNFDAYYRFERSLCTEGALHQIWTSGGRSALMSWVFDHNIAMLREKSKYSQQLEEESIVMLADLYVKNLDYHKGRVWADKAVTLLLQKDARSESEQYKLASLLKILGRFNEAEVFFRTTIEMTTRKDLLAASWFHLGEMQFDDQRGDEALRSLGACLALNPDHKKAREIQRVIEIEAREQLAK